MSDPPLDGRAATALDAATAGAEAARERFRGDLAVETKSGATDFVTDADREAQRRVVERLEAAHPEEPVVGEEDGRDDPLPESGPAWVVDPIDGTLNYVRGSPLWATSVAAVVDGEAVAAANVSPAMGEVVVADRENAWRNGERAGVSDRTDPGEFLVAPTLSWARDQRETYAAVCRELLARFDDQRRYGSAQFTLAAVATGAIEGAVATNPAAPWDTVAGVHQIRAAGGVVTDREGARWHPDSGSLVASNGAAHEALLGALPDE